MSGDCLAPSLVANLSAVARLSARPAGCNATHVAGRYDVHLTAARYIPLVAYVVAFIIGLVGNGLVIYVVARFSKVRLKSVANYYIWNLAFADLLFVCSLPLFFWASAGRAWPVRGAVVGQLTCRVAYAARGTSRFAGVFTLIALSVDRCLATFPRQRHLRTIRAGKLVCGAIWLAAFLFSTPYLRYATTTPSAAARARGLTAVKCRLPWPGYRRGAAAWVYTMLTVDLLIPTCVILVAYGVIWRRVRRVMARARAPTTATSSHRPNRKMTRTVLVIVVSFVLCQMPYHVMQVVSLGKMPTGETPRDLPRVSHSELVRFVYLNMVAQVLIFVAACCNPIIYGLLNDNYGRLYSFVLSRCLPCRRRRLPVSCSQGGHATERIALQPPSVRATSGLSETANGAMGGRLRAEEVRVEVTAVTEL